MIGITDNHSKLLSLYRMKIWSR